MKSKVEELFEKLAQSEGSQVKWSQLHPMMHFPIACWNQQGRGSIHLHGHSHGSYNGEGKILDVGIDSVYNIFGEHKLFSSEEVLSIVETKQVHVKDHHKEVK